MAIDPSQLQIVWYPAPVLTRKAAPIEAVTDEVRAVADRMIALMHEAQGVGLAGPQVGLPWRLFVANPTGEPDDDAVYINPVLREASREVEDMEEGCLSLPEIRGVVRRNVGITIAAMDRRGEPMEKHAEGLEARIWQHETDHLDGVLILNRMRHLDRMANRRAIKALEQSVAAGRRR